MLYGLLEYIFFFAFYWGCYVRNEEIWNNKRKIILWLRIILVLFHSNVYFQFLKPLNSRSQQSKVSFIRFKVKKWGGGSIMQNLANSVKPIPSFMNEFNKWALCELFESLFSQISSGVQCSSLFVSDMKYVSFFPSLSEFSYLKAPLTKCGFLPQKKPHMVGMKLISLGFCIICHFSV